MVGDGLSRVEVLVVECAGDRVEWEAERAQRDDPVEAVDVVLAVHAVPARRALGGRQQPDLVVVMERAHREAGAPRELADLPHGANARASRYVRFKS
jgi:hypothetical protein